MMLLHSAVGARNLLGGHGDCFSNGLHGNELGRSNCKANLARAFKSFGVDEEWEHVAIVTR